MQDVNTQNHHLAHKLHDLLIPSRLFAVTIPILVLTVFVLLGVLISYTRTQDSGNTLVYIQEEAYFTVSDFFDLDRVVSGAATYVVWLILGAVVYLVGWAVVVAVIDWYNDIIVSKYYIHPKSFNKSSSLVARLTKTVFKGASLLAFVCFIVIAFRYLVPYSIASFVFDPDAIFQTISIIDMLVACALSFLMPYTLLLLAKLFFMRSSLS